MSENKSLLMLEELQYAPNCLEHRKCIKMDLKCPTIVLNCLHILDYIFMVDLKSKNLHMGTHKGQNSQFFKMPEFRPFLRMWKKHTSNSTRSQWDLLIIVKSWFLRKIYNFWKNAIFKAKNSLKTSKKLTFSKNYWCAKIL